MPTSPFGMTWILFGLYRLNTAEFGQFFLGKIVITVASRRQILRQKSTKLNSAGVLPQPGRGAHSAPKAPIAGFKGTYF